MNKKNNTQKEDWWDYEPPATPYDLVGNNIITILLRPYLYIAIRFYFKFHHKFKISGYKPDFSKHPYIIIANHSSHMDTPLIFSCFPLARVNNIHAIAALDYFFSNPILRILAHLLCNIIPISRKSADFIGLSMCKKVINSGGNIIIYPEGTRTRTGKIGEFKPGVGILIRKTKTCVLPVFIRGTYRCYNYRRFLPRAGPVEIRFGAPLEYNTLITGKVNYEELAERLHNAVLDIAQQFN